MTRQERVDEYRALLRADWDEETMERTQKLLHSFSEFEGVAEELLFNSSLVSMLCGVDTQSPALARDLVRGVCAARVSNDPLLSDVISLVANQTIDLLHDEPRLEGALKLVAGFLFGEMYSRRHSLEGEIHDATGNQEAAIGAWRSALATTEHDDHDYLTRVQRLWFAYLDAGRTEEAEQLVSSLPNGLQRQFHQEVDAGLTKTPKGNNSDLVRISAGLPFGTAAGGSSDNHMSGSIPRNLESETGPIKSCTT